MPVAERTLVEPRHLHRPPWDSSAGGEVADLAEQVGLLLDVEQRLMLDVMFAERGDRWAAREVAIIQPRQNGKTVALEAACLGDMFLYGGPDQLVIWTAHLFPTANEAFIDLKALIDGAEFLSRRVRRITEAAGNQGIELVDGTRLKFLARSKSGGRGFSGSKVYLDESFALSAAEIGSLLPTLSAQPDPQVVYASSAGRLDSDVLRHVRDRGRAGGDASLAYVEWCADDGQCGDSECMHLIGSDGCVLDDRARWRQANPTMGVRIGEDFIASERLAMTPVEFMRERLGWWEDPPTATADPLLGNWDGCADPGAAPGDPVWFGIDVGHEGRGAAIVACGADQGRPVLEVVAYGPRGSAWVADWVAERADRYRPDQFALIGRSPAAALLDRLPDGVRELSAVDVAAGSAALARDVADGVLRHRGQEPLDIAVGAAVRQLSGDGWRWSRRLSSADISPLMAGVVARHVWATAEPERPPMTTEQLMSTFG